MSSQLPPVSQGHIRLILVESQLCGSSFYLDIPIDTMRTLCLSPVKYLQYLGWCILGIDGYVAQVRAGVVMPPDAEIREQHIYYYVVNVNIQEADLLAYAVDLEVIKQRSSVPSASTATMIGFREDLQERDLCCVLTEFRLHDGAHIIPYRRGDEWFRLVVDNRPHGDEDVSTLHSINDIRNGLLLEPGMHGVFDLRDAVILKTPNPILGESDVPPKAERKLFHEVEYPVGARYTLQWICPFDEASAIRVRNNTDATFKKNNVLPLPSDLLLHYNYGAAAVKWWGRGTEVLGAIGRPNIPRPNSPIPAPSDLVAHDRSRSANQRVALRGRGDGEPRYGTDNEPMDEDDVMLFFWGNTKAATQRHHDAKQDMAQRIEQWKKGGQFV